MPASATPRFRLLRFFSITSLVGIVVVMVGLILAYRALTLKHLIEHESRANTSLTRAFANTTWERYRDFVVTAPGRGREALLADPRMAMLQAEIRQQMQGLQVVKVKVYTPQGLTVFSTEIGQIGEDKSAAPGLIAARAGEVVSSLSYREKFNAFEGEISDRNLMSSYVPVGRAAGSGPEAVFEIYSDVTVLLEHEQEAQWQVSGLVLGLLLALYVFLYFMVRRADRVIERQRRERAAQERAMRHQAHHDLLTGLPNRLSFGPRLERALAQATRTGQPGALMFIDLDRFKQVNDRLGHAAGDRLLKVVAERMRAVLRQEDRLFRMGGAACGHRGAGGRSWCHDRHRAVSRLGQRGRHRDGGRLAAAGRRGDVPRQGPGAGHARLPRRGRPWSGRQPGGSASQGRSCTARCVSPSSRMKSRSAS